MKLKNKIYIYSDAIQTGKTTRVLVWANSNEKAYGILTPDVAGKRRLYNVAEKQLLTFEVEKNAVEPVEVIGKFTFLKSAFKNAHEILSKAIHQKAEWLIIDEIGKLELEDKGLEPALSSILTEFNCHSPDTKILIIIRDTLLKDAIQKYNLEHAEIVDYNSFGLKTAL